MSDLIGALRIKNDLLVCIDFDKPLWQNVSNSDLKGIPSLDHFAVDGLLAALSTVTLEDLGVNKRFTNFSSESNSLASARENLYTNKELQIEYIHFDDGDKYLHEDLAKFNNPILVTKLSESEFREYVKPRF